MTIERILAKHPVRNAFSGRSTGNENGCYYSTKGHAINAFDGELQTFDLCLDRAHLTDWSGDTGRETIEIVDEFSKVVGLAVIMWFRMESGRYEFIGYIT